MAATRELVGRLQSAFAAWKVVVGGEREEVVSSGCQALDQLLPDPACGAVR